MKFNLIGAGRLGKNLALSLLDHGVDKLIAVCNKSKASAADACRAIAAGRPVETVADLPPADITFITTPDDVIEDVVAALNKSNIIPGGGIVVHCSGILSAQILKSIPGCYVASMHPLKAFTHILSATSLQGCYCTLEGDEVAVEFLSARIKALGAKILPIRGENKDKYHAAAVICANYIAVLAEQAERLFLSAGCAERDAQNISMNLMESSLTNLKNSPCRTDALSGPLVRGDSATVARHLEAIDDPDTSRLYRILGLLTLPLTALDDNTMLNIKALLGSEIISG